MSDTGTPDISRIVNLILQNPGLIEEISSLAKKDNSEDTVTKPVVEPVSEVSPVPEASETVSAPIYTPSLQRSNRSQLLGAFKPYVSEERAKAIDSMLSIAEILDLMKSR